MPLTTIGDSNATILTIRNYGHTTFLFGDDFDRQALEYNHRVAGFFYELVAARVAALKRRRAWSAKMIARRERRRRQAPAKSKRRW